MFDYLDDANVVAAQYFLSDFLSENREDFYLIILSHITEEHFRGWVLKKKLNTQYIKPTQAKASINTKAFIAFRDSLKKQMKQIIVHYQIITFTIIPKQMNKICRLFIKQRMV